MSRLLRTLFTSVLALILTGGLMAAQAQTVTVDQDGGTNADETTISDGLNTLNTEVGNTSGTSGTLEVVAGDYTGTDADVNVNRSNFTDVTLRVIPDTDDNATALEIQTFDLDGADVDVESVSNSAGDGFLRILSAGGQTVNGNPDIDLAIRGAGSGSTGAPDLVINTSGALRIQDPDNGGNNIQIYAESAVSEGVSGFPLQFQGTPSPGDVTHLIYDMTVDNRDITAGSELGRGTGVSNFVSELEVIGGSQLLFVGTGNDLSVSTFTYTSGDVTVREGFSIGNGSLTVNAGDDLTVDGLFEMRGGAPPSLTVKGSVNDGISPANAGDFQFTQDNGKIVVLNSIGSSPTTGDNAADGDISFNNVTIPTSGNPVIIKDGGDPGTVDIAGSTLTVTGGSGTIEANQDSDFDIPSISAPSGNVDVTDATTANNADLTVGGDLGDVTLNSGGTSIEIAGGTVSGSLNNGNQGGTVTISSNTTYDFANSGTAIDNTAGGEISVSSGATLTIDDTGDGPTSPQTVLNNSPANGVTGDGTLKFAGDDSGSGNIDVLAATVPPGGAQILPAVTTVDARVNLNDGGNNPVQIGGALTAGASSADPTVRVGASNTGNITVDGPVQADGIVDFGGTGNVGNVTINGDVTANDNVNFGSSGSTVGDIAINGGLTANDRVNFARGGGSTGVIEVQNTLEANATVVFGSGGGSTDRIVLGQLIANGPGTVNLRRASSSSGPPDVLVQSASPSITVNASASGTTLDLRGIVTHFTGDFLRQDPGGVGFSNATIRTSQSSVIRAVGPDDASIDLGSQLTLEGLLSIDKNEAKVRLSESIQVDGDVEVEEPGSPSAPNNTFEIADNLFMVRNNSDFIADSDVRTVQGASSGSEGFVVFEGNSNNRDFEIRRNDQIPPFVPTIGNVRLVGNADVDINGSFSGFQLLFDSNVELIAGDLDVLNGGDFSAATSDPRIVRQVVGPGFTDQPNVFTTSNGSFNAAGNPYDLRYQGDDDGSFDAGNADFDADTDTREFQPDAGNVENLEVITEASVQLTENKEIIGTLTVGKEGIIRTDGGGNRTLEASAGQKTHSVVGAVSDFDAGNQMTLEVSGQGSAVNGDSDVRAPAMIQNLTVDASGVSVSDIHEIDGDLTVTSGAGLDIALRRDANGIINPSFERDDGKVFGEISSAGDLTLSSDVEEATGSGDEVHQGGTGLGNSVPNSTTPPTPSNSGVDLNDGSLAFASNDLAVDDGNFDGAGSVTYSSNGGTLFFNSGGTFGTNESDITNADGTIPRVEFDNSTATLSSKSGVSQQLTIDQTVNSGGFDLLFTGTANINFTPAFGGNGFLVSKGTTVNVADADGDDDDIRRPQEIGEEERAAPKSVTTVSTPAQISRFRVDSGGGNTTTLTTTGSPGSAGIEVTEILQLDSGILDHQIDVELTGDDPSFDEFQVRGSNVGVQNGNNSNLILASGLNNFVSNTDFTLLMNGPVSIPNLAVDGGARVGSGSNNLTVGEKLFLEAQLWFANAGSQLAIADAATIERTDFGDNTVLNENPVFQGVYDLVYGDGSATDFDSGRELSDAPPSDPDIRNLTVNVDGSGTPSTVEFDDAVRGGQIAVINELFLQSGESEGERTVFMLDNSTVTRTGNHTHEGPNVSPSRLPDFEEDPTVSDPNYTVRYESPGSLTSNRVELIDGGVVDLETSMNVQGASATIDLPRTLHSLFVNNGTQSGTRTIFTANVTFSDRADLVNGETRLNGGNVTVNGITDVDAGATLRIGSVWTSQGNVRVNGQIWGSSLDANANLTATDATLGGGSSTPLDVRLAGNLDANESSSGGLDTDYMDLTMDGPASGTEQVLDLRGLVGQNPSLPLGPVAASDGEAFTIDQSFGSGTVRKVRLQGADLDLSAIGNGPGASTNPESNGIELNSGVLVDDTGNSFKEALELPRSGIEGYERNAPVGFGSSDNESHAALAIKREIRDQDLPARVGFPAGSRSPEFRLYRFDFQGNTLLRDEVVTVEFIDNSPGGTDGLPFQDQTGVVIGDDYPPYYWKVSSSQDLTLQRPYEVTARAYLDDTNFKANKVSDHRIIRRNDQQGAAWTLLGSASAYDNDSDGTTRLAKVRTADASASITSIGRLFTVGVPAGSEPQLATNAGLTVTEGQSGTIAQSDLEVLDQNNSPSNLTYTVNSGPSQGQIEVNGSPSSSFTQADINSGNVVYNHTASNANDDSFDFTAEDPAGQTVSGTFSITVNPAAIDISGTLFYPAENNGPTFKADATALSNRTVGLYDNSGNQITTTTTGSNGGFTFTGQDPNKTYKVKAELTAAQTEVSIADAARIVDHRVGTPPFANASFQTEIADVNESGGVTSLDALLVARFGLDLPNSALTKVPNWFTPPTTVNAGTSNETGVTVNAAEYGDANLSGGSNQGPTLSGSALASGAKSGPAKSGPAKSKSEARTVKKAETFEVPVRVEGKATVDAYELTLGFDAEAASFKGASTPSGKVLSNAEEGTLKVAWLDKTGETPMRLSGGDPIVTLTFEASEQVDRGTGLELALKGGELVSATSGPLGDVGIQLPKIVLGKERPDEFALKGTYPNPTRGEAQLGMDLPSSAAVTVEVYNALGQRVQRIEKELGAGSGQSIQLGGEDLPSGQYFYRVKAQIGGKTVRKTGQMTVVK